MGLKTLPIKTVFFGLILLASTLGHARDMHGRLGLGYNAQFANTSETNGTPGVSIKYGLTRDIAIAGIVAINTGSPTNSATAIKLFKNIFLETNLNFYFVFGGGIVKANDNTGAEFLGGFGAEFFIPGLESIGFSIETGAALSNISGSFALRTIGVNILEAGVHFYF